MREAQTVLDKVYDGVALAQAGVFCFRVVVRVCSIIGLSFYFLSPGHRSIHVHPATHPTQPLTTWGWSGFHIQNPLDAFLVNLEYKEHCNNRHESIIRSSLGLGWKLKCKERKTRQQKTSSS